MSSVSQEAVPSTGQIRNKFRELEDGAMAQKLQEQEFDQYYNSNVQVRRTAQQDFNVASHVAKKLQAEEVGVFKVDRQLQKQRELEDQNVAALLTSEEHKREEELKRHEAQDLQMAAKLTAEERRRAEQQKRLESEGMEAATVMQDEEIAWKYQEREDARLAKIRQMKLEQERKDAELARMASLDEETEHLSLEERRQRDEEASLKMIQQLQSIEEQKMMEEEERSLQEAQRLHSLQEQMQVERQKEEAMSRKAIEQMKRESMRGSVSGDRPPPPSYDELQLNKDKDMAKKMQREEIVRANEEKRRMSSQTSFEQDVGSSSGSRKSMSPTKNTSRRLPPEDAYPRAVPVQGREESLGGSSEPTAGSDITYGGPQYPEEMGLLDPSPADPKGKKKDKKQKRKLFGK